MRFCAPGLKHEEAHRDERCEHDLHGCDTEGCRDDPQLSSPGQELSGDPEAGPLPVVTVR